VEPELVFLFGAVHVSESSATDVRRVIEVYALVQDLQPLRISGITLALEAPLTRTHTHSAGSAA